MNLNLLKHRQTLLIVVSLWTISCRSTDNPIQEENQNAYNVKINMLGFTNEEQAPAKSASANKTAVSSQDVQNSTIKIDENNYITASLIPQNAGLKNRTQASLNPTAITPGTPTFLNNQVKYKVVVYDSNGARVDEKEFSYTQNDSNGFMLDGGKTYTFVAYSVNSTSSTDTPAVTNGGTLATATLANVNKDLMFFKKNMTVTGNGTNYLDVVLKHQFSQITTILDARQVGTITSIVSPTISPAKSSANLSFNNDTTPLSYNSDISGGAVISFPTPNSQYVSSNPTRIISPTNASGVLNISSVTIDGVSKPVPPMNNIKIDPGVKYDVRLRFGPCRQDVNPTPFSVSNGNPKTFNMPATSFGFVFDIYFLDNSFNMTINGKEIATQEIQFQKNVLFQPQQNVEFADGTGTYEAGYPGIWQFDGNAINGNSTAVPIIRVVISPDGTVSMYGAKQNRGPLYPLRLTNGNTFQKITWNTTSSNTVTATQLRDSFGGTTMNGMGYGKQIIDCINK
ncbi:hypothetical protein KRE40_02075 [Elizabethkingia meningoseptica]|uniref:hypothetical protein n=2 Tax=Elizabethkingia meningoseptica TaxID=238 RepID=UPI0023B1F849|nr:hypothetical protein [Elizabethkingia meningoseptica]MDE5437467.1 hypothetical protein [Elizabethkingia meningoseptica]MDE5507435.1 hypothetical protein [Elizabethkingia meningoseptica]MDE5515282.1 hypothetical protein [Elizabethkingia meningoseptica]MDE5526330.1 hypothetical protein [Elizabethkingia meningoseptica]MDE5529549.1 hypothetical protein [Elizabethkingia meningoseptica]